MTLTLGQKQIKFYTAIPKIQNLFDILKIKNNNFHYKKILVQVQLNFTIHVNYNRREYKLHNKKKS